MEQASVEKSSPLPYLICRIGAGTPVVSKTYLYYFAQPETPSLGAESHAGPSDDDHLSPPRMPLPSTPYSQAGSVLDLEIEEPVAAASEVPRSKAAPDIHVLQPEDLAVMAIMNRGHEKMSTGSEGLQASNRTFDDGGSYDMTPPLPRNPAVTPVAGEALTRGPILSQPDGSISGEREKGDAVDEDHDAKKVADYFSYPVTRVVLLPGTPGADHHREAVTGSESSKPDNRLLLAPGSRPDSMMVEIGDAPWTLGAALDESGPDPAFDVRQTRTGSHVLLAERHPVPDLDALIHPSDYHSSGPRDVVEAHLAAHESTDPTQQSMIPDSPAGAEACETPTPSAADDVESVSESTSLGHSSPAITDDSAAVEKLHRLEPRPVEDALPPHVGKRKMLRRRVRNVACRPILLRCMLGPELACPTKEALRMLARGEELPTELALSSLKRMTTLSVVSGDTAGSRV